MQVSCNAGTSSARELLEVLPEGCLDAPVYNEEAAAGGARCPEKRGYRP